MKQQDVADFSELCVILLGVFTVQNVVGNFKQTLQQRSDPPPQ